MAQPAPTGVEFLKCPTYEHPWTWVQVAPFMVFFVCVALIIIFTTLIYWRANKRTPRS